MSTIHFIRRETPCVHRKMNAPVAAGRCCLFVGNRRAILCRRRRTRRPQLFPSPRRQQQQQPSIRFKSSDTAATTATATAKTGNTTKEGGDGNLASTVVKSLSTAVLGLATISFVAGLVETTTSSASTPAYDPNGQRYDQSTYSGRFARMMLTCDPRLLFYTKQQVESSKHMLDNYEQYKGMDDGALWKARRICDAALHPDTGEILPRPFRMSGYVASNAPICVAMIVSQSTPPLLFWSWLNQSQNALVNYYNRNASSEMMNETLALSYGAAVGSALFVAFGLATAIQKKYPPAQAKQLLRWCAFPSSVVASSLNCYIVRSPEVKTGVPLLDENGDEVMPGCTSKIAAKRGVYSTTASRALLQVPVYFVPPVLLSLPPIQRYLGKHPAMVVPLTTYLLLACAGIGLPATIAIFPQTSEIPADTVEPQYRNLQNPKSLQPYEVYRYNKGL